MLIVSLVFSFISFAKEDKRRTVESHKGNRIKFNPYAAERSETNYSLGSRCDSGRSVARMARCSEKDTVAECL